MDHDNIVHEHIKQIQEIDSRSKSNTKRLDNNDRLIETVYEMNKNVAVIAEQTKQQGHELKILVDTLKTHEEKIESIEDKMETKETVSRIYTRLETLENKDGKKAEKLLAQIKWLLITLIIGGVFTILWGSLNLGG